jgi:cell division protein FtsB
VILAEIAPWMVGLLGAVLGGGLITALVAYRKSGPEVESISVGTMREVTEELRTEISRLKEENEKLIAEMSDLKTEIRALREEMR